RPGTRRPARPAAHPDRPRIRERPDSPGSLGARSPREPTRHGAGVCRAAREDTRAGGREARRIGLWRLTAARSNSIGSEGGAAHRRDGGHRAGRKPAMSDRTNAQLLAENKRLRAEVERLDRIVNPPPPEPSEEPAPKPRLYVLALSDFEKRIVPNAFQMPE